MSLPWTIAKAVFKVVAPNIPEIVSTISKLKGRPGEEVDDEDSVTNHVTELEKTMTTQLQLIEQLAAQVQALQKMLTIAFSLAAAATVLALISIILFLFR